MSLATDLVILFNRLIQTSGSDLPETDISYRTISPIIEYIDENLSSDLSLDSIADRFFISKYYLARIFKEKMSITLHSYITQKRLTMAKYKIYHARSLQRSTQSAAFQITPPSTGLLKRNITCLQRNSPTRSIFRVLQE